MIKNILFDLGNVIIDIDFDRTIQAFRNLGAREFYVDLDQSDPIFHNFEIGAIRTEEFTAYWCDKIPNATTIQIIEAWNALLIGIKPEVFPLLYKLKNKYNLFIYSNTNAIHMACIKRYLVREFNMSDWVPELFTAAYYSHELGYRKPDAIGYQTILSEQQLQASETLFIDDYLPNVESAKVLGFEVIHKPAEVTLTKAFRNSPIDIN